MSGIQKELTVFSSHGERLDMGASHEGKVTGSGKFYTYPPPLLPQLHPSRTFQLGRVHHHTCHSTGWRGHGTWSQPLTQGESSPHSALLRGTRHPKHPIKTECVPSGATAPSRGFSARCHVLKGLSQNDILLSAARGCLSSLKHRAASREVLGLKISQESPQLGPRYCSVQVQRGKV